MDTCRKRGVEGEIAFQFEFESKMCVAVGYGIEHLIESAHFLEE